MSDDEVGSLQDELRRLGQALGDWSTHRVEQHTSAENDPDGLIGGTDQLPTDNQTDNDPDSADARLPIACQSCPICQFIALSQGERTEALEGLLTAAAGLVTALTTYVDKQTEAARQPARRRRADDRPDGAAPGSVQRIDLT